MNSLAQNSIVTENALPGNPASEWDITGAGDLSIQGFATDISVNKGEQIVFKIKTDATAYAVKIFRLGYYQDNGARLVDTGTITASLPQIQPVDNYSVETGTTDCSNWLPSAYWNVPSNAVSGVYIAKLIRGDNNGASHIIFIVRDDSANSPILFKTADATWQAYNNYGGNSLYNNNSGTAVPGFNHATKVSYDRPFLTRSGGGGGGAMEDWVFNAEFPMIKWLERNGYPVSYTTDVDMDRSTVNITPAVHKILLSVGHDEYWSPAQRTRFTSARNTGVHLAFFSGNEVYWQTRWENNHRTLVCYKEGSVGENACGGKCDPLPGSWTGLWRDGCLFPSAGGCDPENSLTGQISWDGSSSAISVPDTYKQFNFWRFTTIAGLSPGQSVTFPQETLGYEWDWFQPDFASKYPATRVRLSSTEINGREHNLSVYRHESGALVFGAGTVQWSWGLDGQHDRGNNPPNKDMQQATLNLFTDMGVQPGSPQNDLVTSLPANDTSSPVTTISSPLNGSTINAGEQLVISGSAVDNGGGTISLVEISLDSGITWATASGSNNWTYSYTPSSAGNLVILARAVDNNANVELPSAVPAQNAIAVNVVSVPGTAISIFSSSSTPQVTNANDGQGIEVGVKFRSSVNGFIKGIRFYKGTADNGTHVGHLWNTSGNSLATGTFVNETASGWQELVFSTPVPINANTTYVASYHSSAGFYAFTNPYFTTDIINGPLKALANGVDGPNAVYKYTSIPAYPNDNYQSSNYWVDVLFINATGPDLDPPVVETVNPGNNMQGISVNVTPSVVFNEALDTASLNVNSFTVSAGGINVPGTFSYSNNTITFLPNLPLNYSTNYTATLNAPDIQDSTGNSLVSDYTWTFTTAGPPPPPPTEGTGGPILVISTTANPFSRYLVEILRAEGLNEFDALDKSAINPTILNNHDVVLLGEMSIDNNMLSMLTDWVNAGGTLIAFKPDPVLLPLLGLTKVNGSIDNQYLLINNSGPGAGIVNQTIQFHGRADLYLLNGATSLANLYASANSPTNYIAAAERKIGANGGKAITFSFDLSKSIVYTRQGNPAWSGQSRDGQAGPIRSDNLFFPDWIDFNKIAIPQADEQQRFLANIIIQGNLHRKPLPRFWFLPRKLKAAVVMTGDDHGTNGTIGRFNQYLGYGNNSAADVLDWNAVRATSYIYTSTDNATTITNAQAMAFEAQGFEVAAHITTNCENWTSLPNLSNNYFTPQLTEFATKWPGISAPVTNRTHCIAWSDWASQPKVEQSKGIRLDVNYYYWPESWMANRPGMFTGSGMPMRFADADGTLIDCYQVPTQMTDETNMNYASFANNLLDKAIGSEGYYGVFAANMHNDDAGSSASADAIIGAARQRQIPVISAKQLLTWLDGRNSSHFDSLTWSGNNLSFSITVASGANKLQAMLPVNSGNGRLVSISRNGSQVTYTNDLIKGINYAFFDALTGAYIATYLTDSIAPEISNITVALDNEGKATISWTTNKPATSAVHYALSPNAINSVVSNDSLVTNHSIMLTNLLAGATYHFRVVSNDGNNNIAVSPVAPDSLSFTLPAPPCVIDDVTADFENGTPGNNTIVVADNGGAVSLKPAMNETFDGLTVPVGFTSEVWDGQAGATTSFTGGQAIVNGTHIYSNSSYGPGTSLEFSANFTQGNFQNIGFSADGSFNSPWIVVGRGNEGDNNVYARNSDGQKVSLGSSLLNALHTYKISWNAGSNDFAFYVDGNLVTTTGFTQTVNSNMVLQISEYPAGGVELSVDWLRATPYQSNGVFESRIFDGGSDRNWVIANWQADIPPATSIEVFVRKGNASVPDSSWSAFTPVQEGDTIGGTSRFIQYKVNLATTNTLVSPVFNRFTISCTNPVPNIVPPTVTNIAYTIVEEDSIRISKSKLDSAFNSPAGDSLASIVINALPLHGVLFVNNVPVQLNQVITGNDFKAIRYNPILDYTGNDSIGWNGAASLNYADTGAFITILVTPVNDPPAITLNSPANGAIYAAGQPISLSAIATDVDGTIQKVEFFDGGEKFLTDSLPPYGLISNDAPPGSYILTAVATDNNGATKISDTIRLTITACSPTGTVTGEGFTEIPGSQVANLTSNAAYPNSPTITAQLPVLEYANVGDNYGGRLQGFICAPITGNYIFYIAGDDQAGIFLSTDENPANKVLLAYNINPVGFRAWFTNATQKSVAVRLVKGARYYFETLHKQSTGTNHMSVAWMLPNGVFEAPIGSNRISPLLNTPLSGAAASNNFVDLMRSENIEKGALEVSVRPNPSLTHFTIVTRSAKSERINMVLTDLLGRELERMPNLPANNRIEIGRGLMPGVYLLQVIQGQQRKVLKLIKE